MEDKKLKKGKIIFRLIFIVTVLSEIITENTENLLVMKVWFALTIFSLYFLSKGRWSWRTVLILKGGLNFGVWMFALFFTPAPSFTSLFSLDSGRIPILKYYWQYNPFLFIVIIVFMLTQGAIPLLFLFSKNLKQYIMSRGGKDEKMD